METTHPADALNPANLLGALAVAAHDAVGGAMDKAIGHGGETAAALVAIGHVTALSNDNLRQVLRLSHPGTVRAVDRLVEAGLAERRPGADRRAIALHLTPAGCATRQGLLDQRNTAISNLLCPLDAAERDVLARLLAKILKNLPQSPMQGLSICRLCDNANCPDCPIEAGIAGLSAPTTGP